MPPRCQVCDHPHRQDIDLALAAAGASFRNIAKPHGVSAAALFRHKKNGHVAGGAVIRQAEQEQVRARSLREDASQLIDEAGDILTAAEQAKDLRTAVSAIGQARGCIELIAKLEGELDAAPVVNLTIHNEWLTIRAAILGALDRHPEALQDVTAALQGVAHGNG